MKFLTIIVPSYNMEAYLPRCVESVVAVNDDLRRLLDVIVVNDGSKDRTSEIAHEFERKHPDVVRVIDKGNGHYGSCINAGLKIAEGEWVKILDADDWFDTAEFERYLERFSTLRLNGEFEEVDLIANDYKKVDLDGELVEDCRWGYACDRAMSFHEFAAVPTIHFPLPSIAYRLSVLREISYRQMERSLYTDLEWVTYPMSKVRKVRYIPESVYRYFVGRNGQSMDPAVAAKNMGMIAAVLGRMFRELKDDGRAEVREYYDKVMLAQLKLLYESSLLVRGQRCPEWLKELDVGLKAYSSKLYAMTDFVATPRRISFHYVREFRRGMTRETVKFWFFDLL